MIQSNRLDMWSPDTNGTIFRNWSITVAINGLTLDSHSWVDPSVIPPWAFKNRADFERASPLFPILGFDNDVVLVPLPTSRFVEVNSSCQPTVPVGIKPNISKKRKAKRPSSEVAVGINQQQKKSRPLLSPSLRLSNSRGGRRGGRGGTGRGRSSSSVLEKASSSVCQSSSLSENDRLPSKEHSDASSSRGMKGFTHLQGCGG